MIHPLMLHILAQTAPQQNTVGMLLNTVLPFVILGIVFWFLFLRPQKKEQQRLEAFRNALKVGDEVITNQGIFGKISSIQGQIVYLEIARSTKIKILKQEIRANADVYNKVESAAEAVEKELEKEDEAAKKD